MHSRAGTYWIVAEDYGLQIWKSIPKLVWESTNHVHVCIMKASSIRVLSCHVYAHCQLRVVHQLGQTVMLAVIFLAHCTH